VGGHLKNTVAVTVDHNVFVSQHIGDLENAAAFDFFRSAIDRLRTVTSTEPKVAAHDLHPDYLSTRYALGLPLERKIAVQHHHAHIAACMGEADMRRPVIGLALDGTGYGPDGAIWGCEILKATREEYERIGHLRTVAMPGGEAAVRRPWRMAVSHLVEAFEGEDQDTLSDLLGREPREVTMVRRVLQRNINCPETSSCGRLFDAVSAILGICGEASYEGQAAIELEMASRTSAGREFAIQVEDGEHRIVIDPRRMLRAMVEAVERGEETGDLAMGFHRWLVRSLRRATGLAREETGLETVALSGGCFQNRILRELLEEGLVEDGFEVLINRLVPTNDGGISFGQVVVAAAVLERDAA
jgi:hydrogenase maturation protein HypF